VHFGAVGGVERAVPTIGEALGALEANLFVGRGRHLAQFRNWLASEGAEPSILNVTGPGGVGKTALLTAFERTARSAGRSVVTVDGRDIIPLPDALLNALGTSDDGSIARLNRERALLMLDTFEELEDLTPFLQREFLPKLDTGVRVVIAGRYPLGRAWAPWQKLIRLLRLRGLTRKESEVFLARRGIADPGNVEQIVGAAGGLPLALSLAADMVQQLGVRRFKTGREWPLVVRQLVERLLEDVRDPAMRELLDVCAVVRQFDEQTLEAVAGRTGIGPAFDRLCRLSVVRPAEHGLMLHEDIRRILAEDLRWRQPARHRELRLRALAHYRNRSREAPAAEREWLVAERLFLWGNELLQELMFRTSSGEEVYLEPADRSSMGEIQGVWEAYVQGFGPAPDELGAFGPEEERAWREALISHPAARLRIARTAEGEAVGFSASVPVYEGSAELLLAHPVFSPLLDEYLGPEGMKTLPAAPEETVYQYLLPAAAVPDLAGPAQAALLRDVIGQLASGGVYLTIVTTPERKRLCEAMGFEAVEGTRARLGPGLEAQGYVLDLRGTGVEAWLEALIRGRPGALSLPWEEMEREVQSVLTAWPDDGALARSPLAGLTEAEGDERARAKALRGLIREALVDAREAAPDREPALKAIELAYLDRSVSHERVAERLAVSRSTFYRLLKRGVQALARALAQR
jgi:AAA ATPase-like protein